MFLVIRNYKNINGNTSELQTRISNDFVPLVKKINGFVDYYCLMPDNNSLVSVSVFQDEKGAHESVKAASDWVAKNLAKYFPEKPEVISGEVFTGSRGQQLKKAA